MSTLTYQEQKPGEACSSTVQNANAAAWDAATAAINGDNVRREGLDYHNFTDAVVEATSRMGSGYIFDSGSGDADDDGPSAALNGPDAPVIMNAGAGNTVQVGPFTPLADDDLIIRCSALISAENVAAVADCTIGLEYTDDAGATWASVSNTQRPLSGSTVGTQMWGDYTVTHYHTLGAGTFEYRLVVVTSTGSDVTVQNAVMYGQIVAH